MAATNQRGLITRRGFLECGSAALAGAGLIGNSYASKSTLSSESTLGSAEPGSAPLGKIMRSEISTLKLGKESSTLTVDASQTWIAVVSTSASFR
jgi:hypothetical protein